jgi:hypothetical protein
VSGAGPRPVPPLGQRLARLARAVRHVRRTEAVFVGLAAAGTVAAAAEVSGAAVRGADGAWLAALVGLVAAGTWWRALPVGEGALARRLDRGLDLDGRLLAALAAERSAGLLAPLLVRETLGAAPYARWLRAALPDSTLVVAAPLAAAAALALALERRDEAAPPPRVAELAGDLASALAKVGSLAADETGGGASPWDGMQFAAAQLAERSRRRPELAEALLSESEELFAALAAAAARTAPDAPEREDLDRARALSETLRAARRGADREPSPPSPDGEASGDSEASRGSENGSVPGPGAPGAGPGAGGAADPQVPPEDDGPPELPEPAAADPGAARGVPLTRSAAERELLRAYAEQARPLPPR